MKLRFHEINFLFEIFVFLIQLYDILLKIFYLLYIAIHSPIFQRIFTIVLFIVFHELYQALKNHPFINVKIFINWTIKFIIGYFLYLLNKKLVILVALNQGVSKGQQLLCCIINFFALVNHLFDLSDEFRFENDIFLKPLITEL